MMMGQSINSVESLNQEPTHPLVEALRTKSMELSDFLEQPRLLEELQNCASSFSEELAKHDQLQRDLLDCILRPQVITNRGISLPLSYPYRCSEIFVALEEAFSLHLLDQVRANPKASIMAYMFTMLESEDVVNETCAGYLLKLVDHLFTPELGFKFLALFQSQPTILSNILRHIYNQSIGDLFLLILSAENAEEMKLKALEMMFQELETETLPKCQSDRIEGVNYVVEEMVAKMRDGARLQGLIEKVIAVDNIQVVRRLVEKAANEDVVALGLMVYYSMLQYYKLPEPNPMFAIYGQPQRPPPLMQPPVLESFTKNLKHLFQIITQTLPKQSSVGRTTLSQLLASFCSLFPSEVKQLIDLPVIKWCLVQFPLHPTNNLLHNNLKTIVEMYIQKTDLQTLKQESLLFDFINSQFLKETCYSQHLYKFIERLLQQGETIKEEFSERVVERYQQMKKDQSQPIGEDKQNNKLDNNDDNILSEEEEPVIHFDPANQNGLSSLLHSNRFDMDIFVGDSETNVKIIESPVVGRFTFDPDIPFDDNILAAEVGQIHQIVDSFDDVFAPEVIPVPEKPISPISIPNPIPPSIPAPIFIPIPPTTQLNIEDLLPTPIPSKAPRLSEIEIQTEQERIQTEPDEKNNNSNFEEPASNIQILLFIKGKLASACGSLWRKWRR